MIALHLGDCLEVLRTLRRHHRARLMRGRSHYHNGRASQSRRDRSMVARTPCLCSCLMCGNERHHAGETMQERRATDRMREGLAIVRLVSERSNETMVDSR